MSLFDVIRYPISDIESIEVERVPREIWLPWIEECYELAGKTIPANLNNANYTSLLMIVLLLDIGREADRESLLRVDLFREFFKYRLIERIKEYDSTEDGLPDFPSQISKSDSET